MIGALPQTPEFIAFVFPKMGRKNRRQKSAAHFGVKSVQPLRSHSCVAVSCRTEKANYIINNCLEDYSIYTVCVTLPSNIVLPENFRERVTDIFSAGRVPQKVGKGYLGKICSMPYSNASMTDSRRSFIKWLKGTETMNF